MMAVLLSVVSSSRKSVTQLWKRAFRKTASVRRFSGRTGLSEVQNREKEADRKSYHRKSECLEIADMAAVTFSDQLRLTFEVEDLTKRNTSWGDIWEDLYYVCDDTALAEFKHEAFEESLEDDPFA